jgi:hypothetical protein
MSIKEIRGSYLYLIAVLTVSVISGFAEVVLRVDGSHSTAFQLLVIISAFFLIKLKKSRSTLTGGRSATKLLLLFIVVSALSNIWAQVQGPRLDTFDMWRLSLMAFLPTLAFWGGQAWARRAFNTRPIDIGAVILALVCSSSVLLDVIGISEYESYGSRYFGFIGDSVAWILSFAVVYFTISKKYFLYNLIAIIALLFTQSLGASFVVVVALFIYYLKSNELRRRPIAILLNVLLLLSILIYTGLLPLLFDRLSVLDILENDRVRTNAFTFILISENYYFGGGYGIHGYSFEMKGFANLVAEHYFMGTPSSTYLQVLADSGFFGFFIFFTFILVVSRDSFRVISSTFKTQGKRELSGLAAWLVSFMLTNHTAAWLLPASKLSIIVFTVAGIVTALSIMPQRKCALKCQ